MARHEYLFVREEGKRIPRVKFGSWAFVLFSALLLTVVSILDRGGFADDTSTQSTVSGDVGCQLVVSAPQLNVRSGPSQDAEMVGQLTIGERTGATGVVTAGYRELERGRWAAAQYLTPVPGSGCR